RRRHGRAYRARALACGRTATHRPRHGDPVLGDRAGTGDPAGSHARLRAGHDPGGPLPRKLTPKLLTVPGKLAGALSAAGEQLDRIQADVLVGFGGYVATPGYLAA